MILVVGDSPPDAGVAGAWPRNLDRARPAVVVVPTLAAARDVLAVCIVDCIVIDVGLPDVDGTNAVAALTDAVRGTPVVVRTGQYGRDHLDVRFLQLGTQAPGAQGLGRGRSAPVR